MVTEGKRTARLRKDEINFVFLDIMLNFAGVLCVTMMKLVVSDN